MTADINACARGLKRAGAEKVYVRDCPAAAIRCFRSRYPTMSII